MLTSSRSSKAPKFYRYPIEEPGISIRLRRRDVFYPLLLQMDLRLDVALAETRRILYNQYIEEHPGIWGFPVLLTSISGAKFFGG